VSNEDRGVIMASSGALLTDQSVKSDVWHVLHSSSVIRVSTVCS